MPRLSRFTPLGEMPAVVLDTETTGLDVTSCRLVQVSAVRFAAGAVLRDQTFDRLVNPGVPIPPQATAVHGITDEMIADAPTFAELKPEIDRFIDGAVLVGQSIGFDLAVLLRETQIAGARWREPQFLDTKLLAAALDPGEREFGLDVLAARLGVPIADRHHALGDALVTAAIFERLLPRLQAAGVRTLGDAEARASTQMRIRTRQADQGWYDVTSMRPLDSFESGRDAPALVRLDNFAYRYRVEQVMSRSPVFVSPSIELGEAIKLIAAGASALLVGDARSGRVDGILTRGDALGALGSEGAAALGLKIESVMTSPVSTMPQDALVYRALARMQRIGVDQLPVEDSSRRIVGMISLRDLLRDDIGGAVVLGDRLSSAPTARALATARAELPGLVKELFANEVAAAEVAAVISAELRELLARAAVLAERRMEAEGQHRPPVPYALLALGRAGRGEALLGDHVEYALVFASGAPDGNEARWFAGFAEHLAEVLRAAGVEAGPSSAVAVDPTWRRSLAGWREQISAWAAQPQDAEGAARFFDFRLVYGEQDLADDLRRLALDSVASSALPRALGPRPKAANGAPRDDVDLVVSGLEPIEAVARALAVAARIPALSTAERLAEACSRTGLARRTADECAELHEKVLGLVLRRRLRDAAGGQALSGRIDLRELPPDLRREIEDGLAYAARLSDVVRVALALL